MSSSLADTHRGNRCHQHPGCCASRWAFLWQHPAWAPSLCQRSGWCNGVVCTLCFYRRGNGQILERDMITVTWTLNWRLTCTRLFKSKFNSRWIKWKLRSRWWQTVLCHIETNSTHLCQVKLCWGPERPQCRSRCSSSQPQSHFDQQAASQSRSARWFSFWPWASEDTPADTSECRYGSSGCSQ